MTKTEQAMETNLRSNFSLEMLCKARPDVADLLRQAYKAGFADGALWQTIQIRDFAEAA